MASAAAQAMKDDLRAAELVLLNGFHAAVADEPFRGLYDRNKALGGTVKFVSMGGGTRLEEIVDEIKPGTLVTEPQSVIVKEFGEAIRIPVSFWDEGRRLAGSKFEQRFNTRGGDAAHLVTERLTSLIEANTTAIWKSAYFSDAGTPIGARAGVTVDNIYTANLAGATPTVAEARAAFHGAIALFASMLNDAGRPFHGANPEAGGLVLMYHPNRLDVIEEVFAQKFRTGGGDNPLFGRVELRANTLLADGIDMFVFRKAAREGAALNTNDFAPPVLHNNAPQGGRAEESVMLQKAITFATWFDFIEGYGSPMESVFINLTAA